MRGYCATCGKVVEGRMLCPQCGIKLAHEPGTFAAAVPPELDDPPDGPPFLRRMALGAITLLGLYNGLKHLLLAVVLAHTSATALPSGGLICLLVVATLVASVVAGTVNRRAEVAGLILAGAAVVGYFGPELIVGGDLPDERLVGIPTLLVMVGIAGGLVGRLIIPPAPNLPRFTPVDTPAVAAPRRPVRIVWWRILVGTVLVVLGTNSADLLRQWLLVLFRGQGGSAPLVAWQISIVAALVGGMMAGAHTRGGFRHGLLAGLLAGAGTIVAVASADPPPMILEFWLEQLSVNEPGPLPYAVLGGSVCAATMIGGWLGEQFLPAKRRR
jgi:hypothetical protein